VLRPSLEDVYLSLVGEVDLAGLEDLGTAPDTTDTIAKEAVR